MSSDPVVARETPTRDLDSRHLSPAPQRKRSSDLEVPTVRLDLDR